jgi:hypothetical protein
MLPRDGAFEVYVTDDAGKTWNGPAIINAADENRPWINFGLNGGLGVMWRTNAVDAYAVYSFDSGKTFSKPVKVNSATYPAADSNSPGDDWSTINSDNDFVYVAWPDGRNGQTIDGILARVPLALFK